MKKRTFVQWRVEAESRESLIAALRKLPGARRFRFAVEPVSCGGIIVYERGGAGVVYALTLTDEQAKFVIMMGETKEK